MPAATSSIHKFSRIALPDLVAAANETFAERMRALTHKRAFTFVDLLSNAWLDANGGSWNTGPASVTAPFRTRTVSEWEGLVSPPAGTFISTYRNNVLPTSPYEPLTTVTASGNHHALVIPYRKNCLPTSAGSPIGTISTVDGHGLLSGEEFAEVENWHYRMVSWNEQALAQRFPHGYELAGNQDERTMQAGNAVSCNAAQYLGERFAELLAGRAVSA